MAELPLRKGRGRNTKFAPFATQSGAPVPLRYPNPLRIKAPPTNSPARAYCAPRRKLASSLL